MNNANLINQSSSNVEYYTPKWLAVLVRQVLGTIDLDPASCALANKNIRATNYYTLDSDGLTQPWNGRVWMNHPFHRKENKCKAGCKKIVCQKRGFHLTSDLPGNAAWTNKLVGEFEAGNVREALCITFSSMSEDWMKPLLSYPQCFPHGRIAYEDKDGNPCPEVTKGSLITYLGPNLEKFKEVFSTLGTVKVAV